MSSHQKHQAANFEGGGSELEASSVLRVLDSELSRIHHGVAADETIVQ